MEHKDDKGSKACSSKKLKKKEAHNFREQTKYKEKESPGKLLGKQTLKGSNANRKAQPHGKNEEPPFQKMTNEQKLLSVTEKQREGRRKAKGGKDPIRKRPADVRVDDALQRPIERKERKLAIPVKNVGEMGSELQRQLQEQCTREENVGGSNVPGLQERIDAGQQGVKNLRSQVPATEEELRTIREQPTNFAGREELLRSERQRVTDLQKYTNVAALQDEISAGQQQVIDVQSQLRSNEEVMKSMEQQINNLRGELQEKDTNMVTLQDEIGAKQQQVIDLQSQLITNGERMRSMEQEINNLRGELQEKDTNMATLQDEIGAKQQQVNDLQSQLRTNGERMRSMEQQINNLRGELQEKDTNMATLQDEVGAKQQQVNDLQSQLRSNGERMRSMEEQINNLRGELQEKDTNMASLQDEIGTKQQQANDLQSQLRTNGERMRSMEQEINNLRGELEEKDTNMATLQDEIGAEQQQVIDLQSQLRTNGERMRAMEQEIADLRGQLQEKDTLIANLQEELRAEQQRVTDLQWQLRTYEQGERPRVEQQRVLGIRRGNEEDRVIDRSEIEIGTKQLGEGGWGRVVEGKFQRCPVAVKQLYDIIDSSYNRELFQREIEMASRCRHPCLLQFIGATNDRESPLFVMELMETSLRALLDGHELSETDISVISLDVARALNYLHKKNVIHRDISSANVLLWRQGNQWRGKVSDYGTANFKQLSRTMAPGAMIYSAPEALTPNPNQTEKVGYDKII